MRLIKKLMTAVLSVMLIAAAVMASGACKASAATTIPSGAKEYEGHMYYVYVLSDEYITQAMAEDKCQSVGGHLVSITSAGEQDFVTQLVKSRSDFTEAIIGGTYDKSVKWTTGEKMSFVAGSSEVPTQNYPALIMQKSGCWNNIYYTSTRGAYVCEWDTSTETVLPGRVESVSVKKNSKTSLTVTWKKVTGAKGYAVYMKTGKKGTYKKVADITEKGVTSFYKTGLKKGTTYYFRIRAYKSIYGERSYGELSLEKSLKLK